jgi:hypothetical protein
MPYCSEDAMRKLVILLVLFTASRLSAGGTVDYRDVRHLLRQQPAIERLIASSVDVASTGVAVRLGNHWKHLGGMRVGPYVFAARPRNSRDEGFDLVVCTQVTFLTASGKETRDPDDAASVREQLVSVGLMPAGSGASGCASQDR